jgi:hypothetical protein
MLQRLDDLEEALEREKKKAGQGLAPPGATSPDE